MLSSVLTEYLAILTVPVFKFKIKNMGKTLLFAMIFLSLCVFVMPSFLVYADETVDREKELRIKEQEKEVYKILEKILELRSRAEDASLVPEIESAYREIITKYPESARAQESYMRLISLYLNEYYPPAFGKAESLFKGFSERYPDSLMRIRILDLISEAYYKHSEWNKLLRLHLPAIKKFIETGKLLRASDMYMYSEAKLNLGDIVEAVKGYKIVVVFFPESREGKIAEQRLRKIQNGISKNNR